MEDNLVYMDSSAILKRYLMEEGTEEVDALYRKAEKGEVTLCFSIWNIGEVIGVLDRYMTRKLITGAQFREALNLFYGETEKHVRLGSLIIEPLGHEVLTDSWTLLLKHHIYVADAVQLSTARKLKSDSFISADNQLAQRASDEGFEVLQI